MQQPILLLTYHDDAEICQSFEDDKTLFDGVIGYKLNATFFKGDQANSLYMGESHTADLINGECLLATPANLEDVNFTIGIREVLVEKPSKKKKKKPKMIMSPRLVVAVTDQPRKKIC